MDKDLNQINQDIGFIKAKRAFLELLRMKKSDTIQILNYKSGLLDELAKLENQHV